ncbi:MAG: thiamine-phosphate kinase [Desulfonauticus sp.]|nr:thiamine-phosphate kinase [Desulfonauticus sp.]
MMNEDSFLEIINTYFQLDREKNKQILVSRGDDCCLVEAGKIALSSDLFLEDVHFSRKYFGPKDIGYKALAVNLSDLAACGASPLFFMLNLIWPTSLSLDYAKLMFQSMADLAYDHQLTLVGGDLSRGDKLGLCITIAGQIETNFVFRQQAKPGDLVFVVGNIGLSRVGLEILEKNKTTSDFPKSVWAHLRPTPLVKAGKLLASWVKSMLDVSDGIAKDIQRLLPSGLGVKLRQQLPLDEEIFRFAQTNQLDPLCLALEGGEDYALMGVIEPNTFEQIKTLVPQVWILGEVIEQQGLFYKDKKLEVIGFDHFANDC